MSDDTKKSHDDKLKLKVALAMIKADKSVDIICREFNISTHIPQVDLSVDKNDQSYILKDI